MLETTEVRVKPKCFLFNMVKICCATQFPIICNFSFFVNMPEFNNYRAINYFFSELSNGLEVLLGIKK